MHMRGSTRLQLGRQAGAHAAPCIPAHGGSHEPPGAPQVRIADDSLARHDTAAIGSGHTHAAARLLVDDQLRDVCVQAHVRALMLGHAAHQRPDDGLRATLGEVEHHAWPVEVAQHVPGRVGTCCCVQQGREGKGSGTRGGGLTRSLRVGCEGKGLTV